MKPVLDMDGYWALPGDVRDEFNRWLRSEGLGWQGIIELALGEGFIAVIRYARKQPQRGLSRYAPKRTERAVYPVRTMPPMTAFRDYEGETDG